MEPQWIGPYRLERKLGAGGMGVVYAAWDERLERRVALKQIRPEGADDPRRRERLRREARTVAKLDHPAIVRIHDLVETPEGDWLVLQYVDGVTLAERLRQGPLPPEQVVSLARDVLSALEAAHTQGLLHRDLKAENVMLEQSGRAMVLDFGLAKLYAPDSPRGGNAPTASGSLVGTYRSMSPEQANGYALDPRSDLFSLGVLLYEAATGVSPFQGETPVDTLANVCAHLQPPVHELAPAVPEPLSAWIDALLEKDLGRRPSSAGETLARLEAVAEAVAVGAAAPPRRWIAAPSPSSETAETERTVSTTPYRGLRYPRYLPLAVLLVLVAGVGLFLAWRFRSSREPLYVAVARPEIGLGAGREDVALAASALHAASLRALASLQRIAVLTPGAQDPREPAPSVQQLSRLLAADEVLTPALDCQTRRCLAVLRRLRGSDGKLLDVQTFEVPLDDLHLLDTATATYVKNGYSGFQTRPDASPMRVRGEDYERFLRVKRTWDEQRPADLQPLLDELGEIRAGSPLFVDAYLLEADLARRRFFETRDAADLDHALDLIDQARAFAPGDPLPLVTLFNIAMTASRLDQAEEAVRELERRLPGDAQTLSHRALLSEQQGEGRQALDLMRTATARHPSAALLLDLASLEMRQAEISSARSTLEGLLLRVPGHLRGEKLLAQLELESGSPARAVELYSDLARRNPGFTELSNLGVAQLLLGRYGEAAASLRQAYALAPNSSAAALNLADAEMLRGRRAEAEALYRRTLELVERDPAPTSWQTLTVRAQALAHLGKTSEAATAIQQAVLAAPNDPQVAYYAALVHAVNGDTASALSNTQRAVGQGFDPRWFSAPWFDRLRKEPAFQELLESRTDPTPHPPAAR
ncbi:MAG TPA: protein kinase [Thermoanaerobaculia bacterium]|nr:protein kinase [Thermoanaerobaculia bacterium]